MTKRKLKLFVWENVLQDYTYGIMFALAYDIENARTLIMATNEVNPSHYYELLVAPKIYDVPVGYAVSGGG